MLFAHLPGAVQYAIVREAYGLLAEYVFSEATVEAYAVTGVMRKMALFCRTLDVSTG